MASQTMRSAKPENPFAPPPMQAPLTKMKQEEEEELWISGEELYTEGSSDEEDYRSGARTRRRTTNNNSSRSSSTNISSNQQSRLIASTGQAKSECCVNNRKEEQESGVYTATARLNTANPANKTHTKPAADSMIKDDASMNLKQDVSKKIAIASSSNEKETDVKISWKVNRGSFILPKTNNSDGKRNGC